MGTPDGCGIEAVTVESRSAADFAAAFNKVTKRGRLQICWLYAFAGSNPALPIQSSGDVPRPVSLFLKGEIERAVGF